MASAARRGGSLGRRASGELEEALRWAAAEVLGVVTIGLGSNLLVADDGVDALVLRLAGELAAAATEEEMLIAGGGAANAVCLHRRVQPAWVASSSRARSPEP